MESVQLGTVRIVQRSETQFQVYSLLDRASQSKNVCVKIIYIALYVLASIVSAGIFAGVDAGIAALAKKVITPVVRSFVERQQALGLKLNRKVEQAAVKMRVLERAAKSHGKEQKDLSDKINGLRQKASEMKALMAGEKGELDKATTILNRKRAECKAVKAELEALKAPELAVRLTALVVEATQLDAKDMHELIEALEGQKAKRDQNKRGPEKNVKASEQVLDGGTGGVGGTTVKGDARKARKDSIRDAFVTALRRASQTTLEGIGGLDYDANTE